ncbi:CoA transferase [Escherichia coli]
MFDATLSFLEHGLMAYIATGKVTTTSGKSPSYTAPFDVFNTQDKPITICCGNDKLFLRYVALGVTELVNDPHLAAIFYAYKTRRLKQIY